MLVSELVQSCVVLILIKDEVEVLPETKRQVPSVIACHELRLDNCLLLDGRPQLLLQILGIRENRLHLFRRQDFLQGLLGLG